MLADGTQVTVELQEDGTPRVVTPENLAGKEVIQIKAGFVLLALATLLAVTPRSSLAGPFPGTYDLSIAAAWKMYHPGDDWRWWKAQLWQESLLDPNARSPVGAEGIAQFMPATARQYGLLDRRAAEPSIFAGAKLMRDNLRYYHRPRTPGSRRRYAQAAYNCGPGNVDRAQARCGGSREYPPIAPCLPSESRTYVERIERWFWSMQ